MWCNRILKPRLLPQTGKKAQVSLELAASFIGILLLLLGSMQLFFWVNQQLAIRQQDYEATRVEAGNSGSEIQVDETGYSNLTLDGKL
ncbi:MAG: hypothetical protein ABIH27_01585 [Candidatus Omnitrophota bacterium]